MTNSPPIAYLEDLKAPELIIDDIPFVATTGEMVTLVLTRLRYDNSEGGSPVKVVVGRLTLARGLAEVITRQLQEYLEAQKKPAGAAE